MLGRLFSSLMRGVRQPRPIHDARALEKGLAQAKALIASGDLDRAEAQLRSAAPAARHSADLHRLLGSVLGASGRADEARDALEHALRLEPESASALTDLGNVHRMSDRLQDAEHCYRQAILLDPGNCPATLGLAFVNEQLGRHEEAISGLRALIGPPVAAPALQALVSLLDRLGRTAEAKRVCVDVLESEPQQGAAHAALGFLLLKRELRPEQALEHFERALHAGHIDEDLLANRGIALQDMGRLPEAIASYDAALARKLDYQPARFHRSLALLLQGEFGRAWPDYETRLLSEESAPPPVQLPRWSGDALTEATLVVYGEQGIGDEIMFASCLPDLMRECSNIVLICADKLESIFRRSFPSIEVIGVGRARAMRVGPLFAKAGAVVPIGSLPLYYRSSLNRFPQHRGYLKSDPALALEYRERLQALGPGPKVGLSWRGGTIRSRQAMRTLDRGHVARLLETPGIQFVNLQYDSVGSDPEMMATVASGRLAHWPEALADLDRTAALICGLDLVVSVCNSLVHLTGALGQTVWVMAPFSPEWRYGIVGEGMPWYPSARITRQRVRGDWSGVLHAIGARLNALAD